MHVCNHRSDLVSIHLIVCKLLQRGGEGAKADSTNVQAELEIARGKTVTQQRILETLSADMEALAARPHTGTPADALAQVHVDEVEQLKTSLADSRAYTTCLKVRHLSCIFQPLQLGYMPAFRTYELDAG